VIVWSASVSVRENEFLFFRWHVDMFPNLLSNSWTQEIVLPECRGGPAGTSHISRCNVYIRYISVYGEQYLKKTT
jgi:hypothetical protein